MKPVFVDYDNSTISISSAFKKRAFIPGTPEYKALNSVRSDFPNFTVVVREFKTNTKQDRYKGLTYDYMRWYIETNDEKHKVEMLKALDDMIGVSKCHSNCKRYPSIKSWFLVSYPDVATFGMNEAELAKWQEAHKAKKVSEVTKLSPTEEKKAA